MFLTDLFNDLNLSHDYLESIGLDWEKSVKSMPAEIPFLEKTEYMRCYEMIKSADDLEAPFDEIAMQIKNSPALKALFWHARCKVSFYEDIRFNDWPKIIPVLGSNSGMFYLFVALSLIDVWAEAFRAKGIPEEYTQACAAWIGGTVQIHRSGNNGMPGMEKQQIYWMRNYINCELFRCGRFEYMNQYMPSWCPSVFRRKSDGLTIALCPPEMQLDAEGFCLYNDQEEKDAVLVTKLTKTDSYAEGTPVSPKGTALVDTLVRLPLTEWVQILGLGDFTPGIHIPSGGGMSLELCKDSFENAISFYKKYFPELELKAFICASWIFSPDYERLLPESNLARFMREIYLFPRTSSGKDGLFFLFGQDPEDYKDLPRDNSVRRAMLSILDEGKRLRSGGMLFLPDDLNKFGTQYYQNKFQIPKELIINKN
jgi:GNAT-like C-terminal domain/N-acyltransferase N-terminal domain